MSKNQNEALKRYKAVIIANGEAASGSCAPSFCNADGARFSIACAQAKYIVRMMTDEQLKLRVRDAFLGNAAALCVTHNTPDVLLCLDGEGEINYSLNLVVGQKTKSEISTAYGSFDAEVFASEYKINIAESSVNAYIVYSLITGVEQQKITINISIDAEEK